MAGRVRGLLERVLAAHRAPPGAGDGATDAELLRRFARERDPVAFELLVWRHGAAVLGVCRRALRDEHAAEDAFQATFLVLARKAGAVRGNVGGWLFKVARRVAARAAARRGPVLPPVERAAAPAPDPVERAELADLLDAEIARLPERLRRAVVLCYLGGRTAEDAARELGCPRGTVLSRLAAARARLAARLARYGLALPATVAGTVGAPLVSSVAAALHPGAVAVPAVSELATEVLRAMNRFSALTALCGVALAAALATGVGLVAAQPGGTIRGDGPPAAARPAPPQPPPPAPPHVPAAADRKELYERAKLLNHGIYALKNEIESTDKAIRGANQIAQDRKRYEEAEEEHRRTRREVVKLEAEARVLKQVIDEAESVDPPAELIERELARDPGVARLRAELARAAADYAKAVQVSPAGGPAVTAAKGACHEAQTALQKRETEVKREVTARARERAGAAHRERLAQVQTDLRLKIEYAKVLKDESESLRAVLGFRGPDPGSTDPHAQAAWLRAQLARLETELLATRLQMEGVVLPPAPAANDDKLDPILRELAALRQEVRELKAQRK